MPTNEIIIRKLGKLKGVLLTSGLQKENQPLYQVINQLIDAIIDVSNATIESVDDIDVDIPDITSITAAQILTCGDETTTFPNSRELLAGTNITFDDSIANERTISSSGGGGGSDVYDAPLSDGDLAAAELIFADGECVIIQVPNP